MGVGQDGGRDPLGRPRGEPALRRRQPRLRALLQLGLMVSLEGNGYTLKDQEKRNSSILLKEDPNTTDISKIMLCHRD